MEEVYRAWDPALEREGGAERRRLTGPDAPPEAAIRLARAEEVDPEAYEAYLRAMALMYRQTLEDLNAAMEYLDAP